MRDSDWVLGPGGAGEADGTQSGPEPGPCLPRPPARGRPCRKWVRAGGQPGSPHRALVGRVHGRVLGAMEGPAKLLELGHAAQHPGAGERPTECAAQATIPQLSPPTPTRSQRRHRRAEAQAGSWGFPPRPAPGADTGGPRPGQVPVVLRCMLVSQHLQVDGLRPPLDAPVLGQDGGGGEERDMRPGVR